jgi:hypothetical protein
MCETVYISEGRTDMRMFENRVLRAPFAPIREVVVGE